MFEIAPAFRTDPSFTARHPTEFTSVNLEVSWIDSQRDVMATRQQLLTAGILSVVEVDGEEITKTLDLEVSVPVAPFP